MLTVLEIIKRTTEFFSAKGLEHPRLEAELILGYTLGLGRMQLYLQFERPLTEADLEKIRPLVRRRGAREPLQYVLGETEFDGLKLKTDGRALIPRPETELLMELIAEKLVAPPARVLDLGTGSGAIALALAKRYPEIAVTAVDSSDEALALARENATKTGLDDRVSWLKSDWFAEIPREASFDLIVANPPYLSADEVAAATVEVRAHEPVTALRGKGASGAGDLEAIIDGAGTHLAAGGLLALETGIAQHAQLLERLQAAGFANSESRQDLTGRDRFVFARR